MTHENFNAICIFASPRSGSNLLVEQLSNGLMFKHGINAKPLYEYLSPHNHITDTFECVYIDREHVLQRPFTNGMDLYRLENLAQYYMNGVFPVFKIFQQDLSIGNRSHIHRHILNDPTVYKICLNRTDIVNQILSYCIGMSTGVWHIREGSTPIKDRIWRTYEVPAKMLNDIGSSIMLHQLWHAEQARQYCNKIVWYHELNDTNWPDLGLSCADFTSTDLVKSTHNHMDIAAMSILNFDEVYNYAKMIDNNLQQIIKGLL